jgi:anti-sigma factor RsiW
MKLALLFYGELSFEDEELVHQHLEICAHCQAEFSRFRTFSEALDHLESDVDPMLLARNRAALRGTVQAVAEQRTWWGSVSDFFRAQDLGWRGVWWKPAGAFALLALGFLSGRFGVGSGGAGGRLRTE